MPVRFWAIPAERRRLRGQESEAIGSMVFRGSGETEAVSGVEAEVVSGIFE
jgi:hypothetical protein